MCVSAPPGKFISAYTRGHGQKRTNERTHTHTRTHTRTHARTHTRTHARIRAYTHTHTHAYAHTLTHAHTHTHTHTRIRAHTRVDSRLFHHNLTGQSMVLSEDLLKFVPAVVLHVQTCINDCERSNNTVCLVVCLATCCVLL